MPNEWMNEATRNQVFALILIDCLRKCNEMGFTNEAEYHRNLNAMVKNRTQDQKELAV